MARPPSPLPEAGVSAVATVREFPAGPRAASLPRSPSRPLPGRSPVGSADFRLGDRGHPRRGEPGGEVHSGGCRADALALRRRAAAGRGRTSLRHVVQPCEPDRSPRGLGVRRLGLRRAIFGPPHKDRNAHVEVPRKLLFSLVGDRLPRHFPPETRGLRYAEVDRQLAPRQTMRLAQFAQPKAPPRSRSIFSGVPFRTVCADADRRLGKATLRRAISSSRGDVLQPA
jgi:hypothetical protein